jgi:SAM-dependent methyltransferase
MFRYIQQQLKFSYLALSESLNSDASKSIPVPSPRLRHRVHGSTDVAGYLEVGQRSWRSIETLLERAGRRSANAKSILDFGCGSGRTIRNIDPKGRDRVMGIDIDQSAINWCQSNLSGYRFDTVAPHPPTNLPDGQFDLIYAISVFTHLNEAMQFSWLAEISRLLAPNGIFIASLHGDYHRKLQGRDVNMERGYEFIDSKRKWFKPDGLPAFYQDAQHTKVYVFDHWSQYFRINNYVERGIADYHDAAVLTTL